MSVSMDCQLVSANPDTPQPEQMQRWLDAALKDLRPDAEVVVRIVDEAESRELNRQYRHINRPTNVLSFPFEIPAGMPADAELDLLGDLVVCAPVVATEAVQQGKPVDAHWAHMLVHGALHLCGYDHQNEQQASEMEALETDILTGLGYAAPYETDSLASA